MIIDSINYCLLSEDLGWKRIYEEPPTYKQAATERDIAVKSGGGGSGLIGAIIAAYVGYKIGRAVMNKLTYKACANAADPVRCRENIRKKANAEKIKYLKIEIKKCGNSKNPAKCKQKIRREIYKLESKM